ncbi:hypothetical protein J4717_14595 [Phaeobacter sp. HS012]|uniref:hypothetical protein n=1 Tax=unclassified Phaeobacter TaxID=2621772 RepID=UPI001B35FF44|nr:MULTISPECIES: hypothetical protein [unclassified Phaeobacter]MBQ4808703.1 hypothetical protein [Phaeobacter sp. HS012]MBQ4883644.1 hypothetical protein [Phaeobacter sp. HS011]
MVDLEGFAAFLVEEKEFGEIEIAISVAWFLKESSGAPPKLGDICNFIESKEIRHNINRSRLQKKLSSDRRVSSPKGQPIKVSPAYAHTLKGELSRFLSPTKPEISYRLLESSALPSPTTLLLSLNEQMNGTYEQGFFDCSAVLMRRLMECLLIRAFNKSGARAEIVRDNQYIGLEEIISQTKKTKAFHLSRGAEKTMLAVKKVGDKAAHSTSYSVVESDITTLATDFRALIADLAAV